MCQSMVNFQSPTAEIRRGKKKKEEEEERNRMKILWSALLYRATINRNNLECGLMPSVMAALPNIGGALCSMPQSLATTRVPCSNEAKT